MFRFEIICKDLPKLAKTWLAELISLHIKDSWTIAIKIY